MGGHWDPQDGGHPASDPAALTRTAARHFKAATGLDLSGCTQVGAAPCASACSGVGIPSHWPLVSHVKQRTYSADVVTGQA